MTMKKKQHIAQHMAVWRNGSALISINEVNLRRARLVLTWVTMFGFSSRCRTFISVCNQPLRSTQSSVPPGSVNEDQLRLGRQRQVWFIPLRMNVGCAGKTVRYLENACHT